MVVSDTTYNRLDDLCVEMRRTIPRWPATQVFPDVYYSAILMLIEEYEAAKATPQKPRRVRKVGGSFQHTGTVVASFRTTAGAERIVVEFDAPVSGMLHVYRPDQVETLDDVPDPIPTMWGMIR